jgi:hypothetical protein
MLRSIKEVKGYMLRAGDGDIGRCKDFLFNDKSWVIRYMVADTGKWLPEKKYSSHRFLSENRIILPGFFQCV